MKVIGPDEIRRRIGPAQTIAAMRDAVLAQARGECDTPMPMHLDPAGTIRGRLSEHDGWRSAGGSATPVMGPACSMPTCSMPARCRAFSPLSSHGCSH